MKQIKLKCNICNTIKIYDIDNTDYCLECGAFLLYDLNKRIKNIVKIKGVGRYEKK